jgi:multisubunit Na+/H+ antiporter MnhB subunit
VIAPPGKITLAYVEGSFEAGTAIGSIIAWLIGLTAVLTVLAITWAGVQMILSTWEEEKFKKARHTMIYAFIGLFVAGLAYAVVTFVTKLQLNTFF